MSSIETKAMTNPNYLKHVDLIDRLLKKTYPQYEAEIALDEDRFTIQFVMNSISHRIPIDETQTWAQIKESFDQTLKRQNDTTCKICFEENFIHIACHKCGRSSCWDCVVRIVHANFGVFKCPFCRHEEGTIERRPRCGYDILKCMRNMYPAEVRSKLKLKL